MKFVKRKKVEFGVSNEGPFSPCRFKNMNKKFYVFNSFTDEAFCGNPAGVIPDAGDLSPELMQKIARQLNLVETVFITRPEHEKADCRFRYFTPVKELPIAGHPTIAGWACLAHTGFAGLDKKDSYIQETGAGNIDIRFQGEKIFTSQKKATLKILSDFNVDDLSIFNLLAHDLMSEIPVAAVDAGLGHIIFGVKSLDILMKMQFTPDNLKVLCEKYGVRECQIFCMETLDKGRTAHTRNLCPRFGLEDPACGNGNAALGAYFSNFIFPDRQSMHLEFEQGNIVSMPAIIEVMVSASGVMIGGNAKMMVEGNLVF